MSNSSIKFTKFATTSIKFKKWFGSMSKDASSIKSAIESLILANKIVIFSKTYCPYSDFAKEAFNALREAYKVIELNKIKDGRNWQETLSTMTGSRTVPQVFLKGNYIGGAQEIESLLKRGELQKMVKV